jgi:hypothetical protein
MELQILVAVVAALAGLETMLALTAIQAAVQVV